jgi:putative transposase
MTLAGRVKIPFILGKHQEKLLKSQKGECDLAKGECDLALIDGEFYLLAVCDVAEEEARETEGFLGVDLGIVQIASDSEGNQYSGRAIATHLAILHTESYTFELLLGGTVILLCSCVV